jgi:peptidoglycan hydrolase-like protein with peptidoglycan-binding domain
MRKPNVTAILGAVLLASIAPLLIQAAAPPKSKKSTHHSRNASPKSGSKSRPKSKHRSRRRDTSWRRGQKGPTPDRINEIQQALAREGAYSGSPSGKWDAQTVAAMRRFQASRNLNPTGKLDALTLQKLGLGSDVAGIAPPQPLLPDGPLSPRRQR